MTLEKLRGTVIDALGSDYRALPVRWRSVKNRARQTPRNNVRYMQDGPRKKLSPKMGFAPISPARGKSSTRNLAHVQQMHS